MITVVVTENGSIKGYLIEDIYIKKDWLKYFTSMKNLKGIKVFGKSVGTDIKIRNKVYRNVSRFLSFKDINKVIRAFKVNGVELNKVLFIPCSMNEVVCKDVSDVWEIFNGITNISLNTYGAISLDGVAKGFIMSYNDLYKGSSFHINMFESLDKKVGNGSLIISVLKTFGKHLSGTSTATAKGFWYNVGAKFGDYSRFTL